MAGNSRKQKKKNKRLRKDRLLLLLVPVLLVGGLIWFGVNKLNPLHLKSTHYIAEYKSEFKPLDNLKSLFMDSTEKVSVEGKVDTETVGDYDMNYVYDGKKYPFVVSVRDTAAPEIKVKDYTTDTTETIKAENFIDSITDASTYSIKMDNREDTKEAGTFKITISATDQYGNESEKSARLIRKEDKQAPSLEGFEKQISLMQGQEYTSDSYKAVDNLDSSPTSYCDTSHLDVTVPGTYNVDFTVRDRSDNQATYTQTVTVVEDPDYGKSTCYLTFDDGPSQNTLKILDILDQYDVKATFFVIGTHPEEYDIMKEIVDRGHTIALHTFSHDYASLYSSEEAYFDDLEKIAKVVKDQTGIEPDCIRFPGGSSNTISAEYSPGLMNKLAKAVQERGYQYFDWNGDSTDASGNNVPVEQLIANATSGIGTEKINILFHDTDAKNTTVEALPSIIQAYKDAGYIFKGVSKDGFAPHHAVNN
ncbi:polysaccharide deacetylase [Ileibacterium valens]|uniref:polysaccharide deacetylase n=1 Tax=Ileibacterium valens TaxID=1862668 RepID=UPI00259B9A0C|nr:polysaccharide deacetylase [Ileibacterium valens]